MFRVCLVHRGFISSSFSFVGVAAQSRNLAPCCCGKRRHRAAEEGQDQTMNKAKQRQEGFSREVIIYQVKTHDIITGKKMDSNYR